MEQELANLVKKCSRCGTCRSQCPILAVTNHEGASPRGLIFMLHELINKRIVPSPKLLEKVYTCLLCDSCTVICPSGVDITKVITGARQYLPGIPEFGMPLQLVLNQVVGRPGLLTGCSRFLWAFQKSGLSKIIGKTGLLKHLPGDIDRAQAIIPDLATIPARSHIPIITPPRGTRRYRIGYFLGCATNLLYPSVARSVVKVLSNRGCEVVVPENLACCGMPHLAYGQTDTYLELAKHNLKLWKKANVDAIISDCASCTSTIAHMGKKLLGTNEPVFDQWKDWEGKIFDFSQFVVDHLEVGPSQANEKITYHDPCHLVRGMGITKQPRLLLEKLGYDLCEMEQPSLCCAGAGSFNLGHYDLSMSILKRKMDGVGRTGAELVATSCPACTMQLAYGLKKFNLPGKVVHPAQLMTH